MHDWTLPPLGNTQADALSMRRTGAHQPRGQRFPSARGWHAPASANASPAQAVQRQTQRPPHQTQPTPQSSQGLLGWSVHPDAPHPSRARCADTPAASAPETAASSPPSSQPTYRETMPRCPAMSARTSASTSSTRSSRLASASGPRPPSTCTTQLSPPCWPRKAAPRHQGNRARTPLACVAVQRCVYSSWRRHQTPASLRPRGARSSHWYAPQRPSSPRA